LVSSAVRCTTSSANEIRGIVNSFGVYQTYYESNLLSQRSSSDISWIGSLQAFLLLIIGVITGPLYDAGYFRPLVFTGSFLVVFGMIMTSLCTAYWQVILAQGLCIGIGSGCLFIPSVAIVSTYFSTKKALATGIAASGSSIAGIICPIVFHRLEPRSVFHGQLVSSLSRCLERFSSLSP
jgi:MFS family permease